MRQVRLRRYLLALALVCGLTFASSFFLFFERGLIFAVSKARDLDISYSALRKSSVGTLEFRGLKAVDKKSGACLFSKTAVIAVNAKSLFPLSMSVDFALRDVNFIKERSREAPAYDTVSGLVYVPFEESWRYSRITGRVEMTKGGVSLKDVSAKSDDIRLALNCDMTEDKAIDSDIVIHFSGRLVSKVPEMLTTAVLRDEKNGWKSLAVKLKGDYTKPSIQVSGKLFRLNIGPAPTEKPSAD